MNQTLSNWGTRSRKSGHEMLTAEEELKLVKSWQTRGDQRARNRLISAFAPMAAATVKRYAPGRGLADPDLMQQANIGLMKAADRFDPERGFRFSTYAVWWVRAEIQGYKIANMSIVKRPNSADFRKVVFNLSRLETEVTAGQNISKQEANRRVAQALSISERRLNDLRNQMPTADSSLNIPAFGEEGEERMSLLPDPNSSDEGARTNPMDIEKLREVLLDALQNLPDRERAIVVATQLVEPPSTLEVLGNRYGISKERVRQLRERGFERLRDSLSRKDLTLDCFV